SGWEPLETVGLLLTEDPKTHDDRMLNAAADQDGNIYNDEFHPEPHDVGVRFYLKATGASSQAQTTFTDDAACGGQPDGTPCPDDGNPCTSDVCNHNQCTHPAGNAGTVCRASAGQCDVAERCTGTSGVCPADAFASATTSCTGTSQGGACDGADHCSGTSKGVRDRKSTRLNSSHGSSSDAVF